MTTRPLHRLASLVFAALLTATILTGIDGLARPDAGSPQWAQDVVAPRG